MGLGTKEEKKMCRLKIAGKVKGAGQVFTAEEKMIEKKIARERHEQRQGE